jgi:glutamate 5-kinase
MQHAIVIKVGTSLLTNEDGRLHISFLGRLCEEIAEVQKSGERVVLVSSGAMASGSGILKKRPRDISERTVFSCVGQPILMEYYRDFFGMHDIVVAQTLLTWRDFRDDEARELIHKNMECLLKENILPIINENDLVANEEVSFGDNDQLSAKVAVLLKAKQLIILSDVDGLFEKNPHTFPDAKQIPIVSEITDHIQNFVGEKTSKNSLGGMASKLKAAKFATENGIETIILSGISSRNALPKMILSQESFGTRFLKKERQ